MGLTFAFLFFALLMACITVVGYRIYVRPARLHERVGAAALPQSAASDTAAHGGRKWAIRVVEHVGEKVPISPQDATIARRYLIAGGFRSDAAVRIYYGLKVVLAPALLFVAFIVRSHLTNSIGRIVILVGGAALGYFLPNLILEKLVDRRMERLRFALPDALDLIVVCMEAGLGLDQAIANVSRELKPTHPDISDELGLVNLEMRAGKRRGEALKNLSDRNPEPELRKLVATMIQSDRFGTGVAEALRTHSDFLRVRRRQEAEERAAKIGVKLVFPIFFFILPAMILVAAGPGILQLVKVLIPLMNSSGK